MMFVIYMSHETVAIDKCSKCKMNSLLKQFRIMTKQSQIHVGNLERYNFQSEQGYCLQKLIANEEVEV